MCTVAGNSQAHGTEFYTDLDCLVGFNAGLRFKCYDLGLFAQTHRAESGGVSSLEGLGI